LELNIGQQLGLDLDRHLVLDAGAGTGKTTVMAERYVEHILDPLQRAALVTHRLTEDGKLLRHWNDWAALLPDEIVAITFTNDASESLRHRIRQSLMERCDLPDPRIVGNDAKRNLLSKLEQAPIGTIDSFLHRLVKPWFGILGSAPSSSQISDESRVLLAAEVRDTALRIRHPSEGSSIGLSHQETSNLLRIRTRLSRLLGGRRGLVSVIEVLRSQSQFVWEVEAKMRQQSGRSLQGLQVSDLREIILAPVSAHIKESATLLHKEIQIFVDLLREPEVWSRLKIGDAENESRIIALLTLEDQAPPPDQWSSLLWCGELVRALTSQSNWNKRKLEPFSRGWIPHSSTGWVRGCNALGNLGKSQAMQRFFSEIRNSLNRITELFSNPQIFHVIQQARDAVDLEPENTPKWLHKDLTSTSFNEPLTSSPPLNPLPSPQLLIQNLVDLSDLARILSKIENHVKQLRLLRDHDDITRMASDLLLVKCPRNSDYLPPSVQARLDEPGEPWTDTHIHESIMIAKSLGDEKAVHRLSKGVERLYSIRAKFRAFIIDEFQDTSPQQWRILGRLWGPISQDNSALIWRPTVTFVGDAKQSIYRFRQAQVTVMSQATEIVQAANLHERSHHPLLTHFDPTSSRDPRPQEVRHPNTSIPSSKGAFRPANESVTEVTGIVNFGDGLEKGDDRSWARRQAGTISLDINHRTSGRLLRTIDRIFSSVFSPFHHQTPGDWYARPQGLYPSPQTENNPSSLEWLVPLPSPPRKPLPLGEIRTTVPPPSNMREMEHELIAARIQSLLNQDESSLGTDDATLQPSDFMILTTSRTHLPDLMSRLRAYGIPSQADTLGRLDRRPVARALLSLLSLLGDPKDRLAAAAFARSPIVGMAESDFEQFILSTTDEDDLLDALAKCYDNQPKGNLLGRLSSLRSTPISSLEIALRHSDLMVSYPDAEALSDGFQLLEVLQKLVEDNATDAATLSSRMREIRMSSAKLYTPTSSLANAVRVMTVHSSKGLESRVVILSGLFRQASASVNLETRPGLLVSPESLALRMHPWADQKSSIEGPLWHHTKRISSAQIAAEERRLLYVAATRVRERLIISGAPKGTFMDKEGALCLPIDMQNKPNLGQMLLHAIQSTALDDSPWKAVPVVQRSSKIISSAWATKENTRTCLRLNISSLSRNSGFPADEVKSVSVFHSPGELGSRIKSDPLHLAKAVDERAHNASKIPLQSPIKRLPRPRQIVIHPSSFDSISICPRRKWLDRVHYPLPQNGIIRMAIRQRSEYAGLAANRLGDIIHRLLEIGLGLTKPADSLTPLPPSWDLKNPFCVDSPETIRRAIPGDLSSSATATANRLVPLIANALATGNLGNWCKGKSMGGWRIQGMRTEWPFQQIWDHEPKFTDHVEVWSPFGPRKVGSPTLKLEVTGRCDLVLALQHEDGREAWLPLDLKTDGSLNHTTSESLRATAKSSEMFPVSSTENEILFSHRLQLASYRRILKNWSKSRHSNVRDVLPGGIIIGTSGRIVCMTDVEAKQAEDDLGPMLENLVAAEFLPKENNVLAKRLSTDHARVCNSCPHYLSGICGPTDSDS